LNENISSMDEMEYTAVILAAGSGFRAGGYKPLWRFDDGFVIDRVIEAADSTCSRIRIVGGCAFDRLKAHVDGLGNEKIELIYNKDWERGMFSSIRSGFEGVDTPVFVHPADIFGVSSDVYATLAAQIRDLHSVPVVRPRFGQRCGHPILLMPSVVKAVREAQDHTNLREILMGFHPKYDIQVDDEFILDDFDTAIEFESLKERIRVKRNGSNR
jgi:molybdenum cofactor cytidylyltransferase